MDSVMCAPCVIFDTRKTRCFSTLPFNDWKNLSANVNRHHIDKVHRNCVAMAENFVDVMKGKKESIVCKLSSFTKDLVKRNRHILGQIIRVILLLTKQNIPVRGHTEERSNFMAVLQSHALNDPILADHLRNGKENAKYTSPDIQNEIITLCADHVLQCILTQCKEAGYFAIMADEATDCSTKEQLSICIRFLTVNEGRYELNEKFIGFVTCRSIKGVNLAEAIVEYLQDCGLDILKLRAQCYDGAGNMAGKYNGVQALIRERVPLASYVHYAFATELSQDPVSRAQMDGRQKLKTLCETRWMSRTDALTTFTQAFAVVVHALETLEADGDDKAGEHVRAILRFEFILTLVACEQVLSSLVGLTAILQEVSMDLLEAVREAGVVVDILRAERMDETLLDAIFQKAADIASEFQIDASVPHQNQRQRNRANYQVEDPKTYWRIALYNVFVDHLIEEVSSRVMANQERFCAQLLLPVRLRDLDDCQTDVIYNSFEDDI
ncbi:zinc finger MYM-type protein 1-like [Mya arenaria]|uniref:zinc finger MYM-type protein 1-like n=1 Tax=Mya arenaria TaxID=6604 RepID=UPI0022E240FC|nr:zinc finger MYM-type protein 1-like [Mya arenaria]